MNVNDALDSVSRLDSLFELNGLAYWLFGGWAVDFHVGRVTREHADIDLAVWQADYSAVDAMLRADGWTHRPSPDEDGYTSYTHGSVDLDVAFLARDSHGVVYTPLKAARGDWPPDSFETATREIGGTRARVVSRASLMADKSQPRDDVGTAAKDAADVAALSRGGSGGMSTPFRPGRP